MGDRIHEYGQQQAGRCCQRRLRTHPRVVKRKMSQFYLKRPYHYHWPQTTQPFADCVARM